MVILDKQHAILNELLYMDKKYGVLVKVFQNLEDVNQGKTQEDQGPMIHVDLDSNEK